MCKPVLDVCGLPICTRSHRSLRVMQSIRSPVARRQLYVLQQHASHIAGTHLEGLYRWSLLSSSEQGDMRKEDSKCVAELAELPGLLPSQRIELPPSLRNNVVVLDAPNPDVPGGVTKVYLLAMSHVSKVSVQQVKDLVRAVRPDVVGVELCRDRVPLLADNSNDTIANLLWHSRKVEAEGLPVAPEWPVWDDIKQLLVCQPGRPVTQQDIEQDVVTLLSTGLFRSARPACQNGNIRDAPAFVMAPRPPPAIDPDSPPAQQQQQQDEEPNVLQTVPPLGFIKFLVAERSLPPLKDFSVRLDSSLKALENPEEGLAKIVADTLAENALSRQGGAVPSLTCLLRARQSIQGLFTGQVVVSFLGVETGQVEALVRLAREDDPAFVSGFEDSARNGEGWGIEVFRPKKNLYKISEKLYLPMEIIDNMRRQAHGFLSGNDQNSNGNGAGSNGAVIPPPRTQLRLWSKEEMDNCDPPMFEGSALADTLVALLTGLYARYQTQAARKLGLSAGAAWQAAMLVASEVGSQQVVLIDRPTVITERKLADNVLAKAGVSMGAGLGLVLTTLIAAIATDILPPSTELAGFAGALAIAAALWWPVVGPLREMSSLADKSAEEIEAAVAIKEPVASGDLSQPLKLYGEDALLDWPGAMEPIIRERDAYMAKALAGLATGKAAFCPLYMRDTSPDGQPVWRLAMPEDAPTAAAPAGLGDGAAKPLSSVRTVVGVVGSAHVRGMVREWQESVANPGSVDSLLTA